MKESQSPDFVRTAPRRVLELLVLDEASMLDFALATPRCLRLLLDWLLSEPVLEVRGGSMGPTSVRSTRFSLTCPDSLRRMLSRFMPWGVLLRGMMALFSRN